METAKANSTVVEFPTVLTGTEALPAGTEQLPVQHTLSTLIANLETLARTDRGGGARWRQLLNDAHRLLKVPELRLDGSLLLPAPASRDRTESPNWWVAPQLDVVSMLQELVRRLSSTGGRIEQTYNYLDVQSARDWWEIANDPNYLASYRNPMPLEQVAALALETVGQVPLDVVALGPGDGQMETRFVQALISHQLERDLRFYLLDISQPLLSKAHRHAKDSLDAVRGVVVFGMFGNFHLLPLYEQLFYSPAKRRRIFTMLGATMNNLEDELRFFRESLRVADSNDLLLVDFTMAFASPTDPARILELDKVFSQPMPAPILKWLSGPSHRNGHPRDVTGWYALDADRPVPGSYSVDSKLKVIEHSGEEREFLAWRATRYDPEQLTAWLDGLGWQRLFFTRFGPATRNQMGLMLLRKRG